MQRQLPGVFILALALGLGGCSAPPAGVSSASPAASASASASESPDSRPKIRRSGRKAKAKGLKAPASAADKVIKFPECGMECTLPDGWGVAKDKDGVVVGPLDESMAMVLIAMEGVEVKDIWGSLDSFLEGTLTDVKKPEKPTESKTGGFKTTSMQGPGKMDGEPALWSVDVIEGKSPLLVLGFGGEDSVTAHIKEADQFGKSFKKL